MASEANEVSQKIGTSFSKPNFDDGYKPMENPTHNNEMRKGKNIAFEFEMEGFRCDFKKGYFADVDSGCQIFHICTPMSAHHKFKCPPGTLFNQRYLVCDWPYNVDCQGSERFFTDNAYQESPNVYDGLGSFGKELQETSKPSSNLVQRSIMSPRKELPYEPFNINEAQTGNLLSSKNQAVVTRPSRLEIGKTQYSVRQEAARSLPPKIIFAYTSDPNPELSLPNLLKDIQSREESQQMAKNNQKNAEPNFPAPLVTKINVSNQPESYLKNLPKRQIETILSTLKKLNYIPDSDHIHNDKKNDTKLQQSHYSFQNVNFGKTKSSDIIYNSEVSAQNDHGHKWNGHTENFLPASSNYLASLNPSKSFNKVSLTQLQRVNNDFSTFREINNKNVPKLVEIPSLEPRPVYQSPEHQTRVEKPSLLQENSSRVPKPFPNRTNRLIVKKQEKLTDDSFNRLILQKETDSSGITQRSFENLSVKIEPNFSVNIVKAKSAFQNQQNENRSTTSSHKNFHHPIKGNGPSSTEDWSMKTADTPSSRDEVKIPTLVTEFPDISLNVTDQNSFSIGQVNDNIALENVNNIRKTITVKKFPPLPSRKRSAESQTKVDDVGRNIERTQSLEPREIQTLIGQMSVLPAYSSSNVIFDESDTPRNIISTLPRPSQSLLTTSLSIETQNKKSDHQIDDSGLFTTSFPASKPSSKLTGSRSLNIANSKTSFNPNFEISKTEMDLKIRNVSVHLPEDVPNFAADPEVKEISTDPYYDGATTDLPIYNEIGNKALQENENKSIVAIVDNFPVPEYRSNNSILKLSDTEKNPTYFDTRQSLKITSPISIRGGPRGRSRSVTNSSGEQLLLSWKNSKTNQNFSLSQNMPSENRLNRRRILKEILKNRLKDFETEESEITGRKLVRKIPRVVNRLKKLKSTNVVKENFGGENSLKIISNSTPLKFGRKNITDENSISLGRNAITNVDLHSVREAQLISSFNSTVSLHSKENLKPSLVPANEFLEFGTKIDRI